MVFHSTTTSRHLRPKDKHNWCDTSSVGSTFSNNSGPKRPKFAREKEFLDNTNGWHVVPSGGAKARSNGKDQHPHPCRYDEHERYVKTAKSTEALSIAVPKSVGVNINNQTDTNQSMIKNKRNDKKHEIPFNMDTTEASREAVDSIRTGGEGSAIDQVHRHELAKLGGAINSTKNIGHKVPDSPMGNVNDNKGQQQDGDVTRNENRNEEENKDNSNTGHNADAGNNESGEAIGGGNGNGKQDSNDKGNGYADSASQINPAFDGEVMQKFVIDFKIRNTPAATIGFIHKAFIKEVLTVAPSTLFVASNKRTIPTPTKITAIDHFPSNHLLHQKFFHRVDIRDKVSFTHDVYSTVSAMEIKRRVMPFLQEHDIGMWSEEISNNTKVRVCWVLNAHSKVSYRPLMTDKLCKGIDEQKENYGDENKRLLDQLPKKMHHIEVQTRTVTHQGHQTVACCVMAYKPAAPVIRELVAMLDHDYLGNGTSIVSEAAARELDPGKYIEIINSNTAFHQNTRTISVKYLHDLYWDVQYRPSEKANYTTVREWIMTGSGVVSIEPTKDTEKEGRYIILCKAEGFPVFRRVLQVMFQTLVKTIEGDEDLKRVALTKFQQYPTIIGPHKIGRYAEKNAKGLLSRIDVPTVPKPAIRPISNKIEFDFGSAEGFPEIPVGTGVLARRANAKKAQKQQSWAAIATPALATYNSTASLASEPSEAGKSTRSARTGITTTDQQTLQSEAMSVLTEFISQARQEDAERRQEEREERRIEREERKAEAAERRRNEDRRDENNRMMFQTMMATIMSQTATSIDAARSTTTPITENTDDQSLASNNKRNRTNNITGVTNTSTIHQDQFNTMDVETETEDVNESLMDASSPSQQNHDVREPAGDPLIQ
jgi:hypothetical protein